MSSLIQSIRHWFARRRCKWHTLVDVNEVYPTRISPAWPPRDPSVSYSYRDVNGRELAMLTPYPEGVYKLFLKDNAAVYFVGSVEDLHGNACPHCIRTAKHQVEQDYWSQVRMIEKAYS